MSLSVGIADAGVLRTSVRAASAGADPAQACRVAAAGVVAANRVSVEAKSVTQNFASTNAIAWSSASPRGRCHFQEAGDAASRVALGSVWIQREFMTAAAILIMAAKL
jgi:hypothetical protein